MHDPHDLQRFVEAQQHAFDLALAELRNGRKRTHWMWFIFPQLQGLGHSEMAKRYGIADAAEALAYLRHPVLGPRLEQCTGAVLEHRQRTANEIFGHPDDLKLCSCMTLFATVAPDPTLFGETLQTFFGGQPDPATLRRLRDA